MVYARNRYYSPGLGRFISEDPIGFSGGSNFYAYCGNDPINFTDPLGLYQTGTYLGDVGQIFAGYGDALNPVNAYNGLMGLASAYRCAGLGAAASMAGQGLMDMFMGLGSDDPRAFGNSLMGTMMTLAPSLKKVPTPKYFPKLPKFPRKGAAAAAATAAVEATECFVAGTQVLMADGSSKTIESVKAGDMVLSKDEATGKIVKQSVVNTQVRTAPSTLVIEVEGGTRVETTPEHPFYVEGTGWTPAGRLAIGNTIVTRAGPFVKIIRIATKETPATVYNFEVEDTHSYFVGGVKRQDERTAGWLWVHNQCRPQHHTFPQSGEFQAHWDRVGLDIDNYTVKVSQAKHNSLHGKTLPNGTSVSGARGGAWNHQWREFFAENPQASMLDMFAQMEKMRAQTGIGHYKFQRYWKTGK